MAVIKIHMHTNPKAKDAKYKRFLAPREAFVDYDTSTNQITMKYGEFKCKPWDTAISRKEDQSYINNKKELYSGLCFNTKNEAKEFMKQHQKELKAFAKQNPIFHHWSIMSVMSKFEPVNKLRWGTDISR